MPNLVESLQGRDLGQLQIIARLWGFKLDEQAEQPAIAAISSALLEPSRVSKLIASLPLETKAVLEDLRNNDGRMPWPQFSRTYGEVREMGAARRDRERPYEHPVSAAETLWYRGLVSKAFFDTPSGPEEFAYIPNDLMELIPSPMSLHKLEYGRPASAAEYAGVSLANDRILDHACTMLAALRSGISPPESYPIPGGEPITSVFLKSVLEACDLLDGEGTPKPEPTRGHLEAGRGEAMLQLLRAWRLSKSLNELGQLPELDLEGNWKNDPLDTRAKVIGFLKSIPANTWWSLASFLSAVKQHQPDFQRPAGDYDSWFIRSKVSGEFLRGFEHWDEVDGRLLAFMVTGPLHWLGVLDLASPGEDLGTTAFRLSRWSNALLGGKTPRGFQVEQEFLAVRSDAQVSARRLVPRRVRYQVSRFCQWDKETPDEYQYRITPASLQRGVKQGLTVSQLTVLLTRSAKAVPPSLVKALERWEQHGVEVRLEQVVVLRVVSEEVIQALRKSRASRFLGEVLGPTSIAIKPGAVDKVRGVLAELGYLGELRIDQD
jgi:hypothetical protein